MPPIPQARIKRLTDVVRDIDRVLRTGEGSAGFRGLLAEASDGAALINRAIGELADLVKRGLRDEAISLYDPTLLDLARALDLSSRPDWIRVHGWMLEQGLAAPPTVDVGIAEAVATAKDELTFLDGTLDRLRRAVLARRPTDEKIAVLRELEESDPEMPLWGEMLREHERQRLRELQQQIPPLVERLDAAALARIREELLDDRWRLAIPVDLLEATDGADIAARLGEADRRVAALLAELEGIDARTGGRFDDWEEPLRRASDELAGLFGEAEAALDELGIEATTPARTLQHDLAMRILAARDESRPLVDRIELFIADRDARARFAEHCRSAEYLCDHPPARGGEVRWLADLDRCEGELNRLCQQGAGLELPGLLQQRLWQARQAVSDDRDRRGRQRVFAAMVAAVTLLGVVVVAGVILARRGERAGVLDLLSQRVEEAERGWHTERPESVERFAGRLESDPGVVELVERFDEHVRAEQARRDRLADLLDRHAALEVDLDRSVQLAEAASGLDRIRPWPEVVGQARAILGEAEKVHRRPMDGEAGATAPERVRTTRDLERERLERARLRQVTHETRLGSMAAEAFKAERDRLLGDLEVAARERDKAHLRRLAGEAAGLGERSAAARLAGGGDGAAKEAIIPEPLRATLDPIARRIATLLE